MAEDIWERAIGTFEGENLMLGKVIWTDGTTRARCPKCNGLLRMRRLEILCRLYCPKCGWTEKKWINSHDMDNCRDDELKPCCLKKVDGKLVRTYGTCEECEDLLC